MSSLWLQGRQGPLCPRTLRFQVKEPNASEHSKQQPRITGLYSPINLLRLRHKTHTHTYLYDICMNLYCQLMAWHTYSSIFCSCWTVPIQRRLWGHISSSKLYTSMHYIHPVAPEPSETSVLGLSLSCYSKNMGTQHQAVVQTQGDLHVYSS